MSKKHLQQYLAEACFMGDSDRVEVLIAQGAKPNSADSRGYLPLHMAAQEGRLKVVKTLLKLGVNVNKRDQDGESALFYAVGWGHSRVVEFLLKNGSDPNARARFDDGGTPLHRAAAWNELNAARILIRHGARADALDDKARKPIDFARRKKHKRMVEILQGFVRPKGHTTRPSSKEGKAWIKAHKK